MVAGKRKFSRELTVNKAGDSLGGGFGRSVAGEVRREAQSDENAISVSICPRNHRLEQRS